MAIAKQIHLFSGDRRELVPKRTKILANLRRNSRLRLTIVIRVVKETSCITEDAAVRLGYFTAPARKTVGEFFGFYSIDLGYGSKEVRPEKSAF